MDIGAIIETIIGGSAVAGITVAITELVKWLKMPYISSSRIRTLEGKWYGAVVQPSPTDSSSVEYNITLDLKVSWRRVKGTLEVETPAIVNIKRPVNIHSINGIFRFSKYFQGSYSSEIDGKVHFGSFILALNDEGSVMAGGVTGYGKTSGRIIIGTVKVEKRLNH